jgi:hypothetical protein
MVVVLRYIERVGIALSVLFNVLTGGASNQTFSARNWDWKKRKLPNMVFVIDLLLGKEHCLTCWVWWKTRKW